MKNTGRILYVDPAVQFKARGYSLYKSVDQGESWSKVLEAPVSPLTRLLSTISLYRRMLRKGIYKLLPAGGGFVLFFDNQIFLIDESNQMKSIGQISGSRPLYPCYYKRKLYYGEYKGNPERYAINILCFDMVTEAWDVVTSVEGIRHIHGIFKDPYQDRLWVTTGDLDHECKIMYSDDEFQSLSTFLEGSQNYRAIYLHFDQDTITYGTDAPDKSNHIFTVSREDGSIVYKTRVGGPVFYGSRSGSTRILTTAVEPSEVNVSPFMEIWVSTDHGTWGLKERVRKDWLPKKLFQYGHIALPEGEGLEKTFVYTPVAGKYDNRVVKSAE